MKLIACRAYNYNMGSIDFVDRLLEFYQFKRKTSSRKISFQFYSIYLMLVNAYNLYKLHCEEHDILPIRHLKFRLCVINYLLEYGHVNNWKFRCCKLI